LINAMVPQPKHSDSLRLRSMIFCAVLTVTKQLKLTANHSQHCLSIVRSEFYPKSSWPLAKWIEWIEWIWVKLGYGFVQTLGVTSCFILFHHVSSCWSGGLSGNHIKYIENHLIDWSSFSTIVNLIDIW
jgi:hypothetical protein